MDMQTRTQSARVQSRWNNDLTIEQRKELRVRHEERYRRLYQRLGLTGWCNDCECIFSPCEFEEDTNGFGCPECGSTDVESPWGNPTRRREDDE
jgi:hypothetical protein